MPKNADTVLFDPGEVPSVYVRVNASGEVATRGDPVKVVDQNGHLAVVEKVEAVGEGHATLGGDPSEFDPEVDSEADVSTGQVVGTADCLAYTAIVIFPVAPDADPSTADTTETLESGEAVHLGPNGAVSYSGGNDANGLGPNGYVWLTNPSGFDRANTVAVAKTR